MPTMPKRVALKLVGQVRNHFNIPEPQIEIRLPKGSHHRLVSAELHKLAAKVELATEPGEGWIVQTEAFYDGHGRVYLELLHGTPGETERAMAVLRQVATSKRSSKVNEQKK